MLSVTAMGTITSTESTNVLRNFVKVGVSSIAYLRNLFAESVFEDTAIGGLQLKRLVRAIPESAALLDWIDHGVFDAMGRKYLKELALSIHNGNNVALETYVFTFKYGTSNDVESGEVSVNLTVDGNQEEKLLNSSSCVVASADKESVKQQTVDVLRDLVLLTQSLSPLPESRYLSIRLMYYDDIVPRDYEPQHFSSASADEQFPTEVMSVSQQVGALETGHHNLAVGVKSCCYIDENITNCKTSARTFDTLTRRPAMSSSKLSMSYSAQRPSTDKMGSATRVPDTPLISQSVGKNSATVTPAKPVAKNRNVILKHLEKCYELSIMNKYICTDFLVTMLGVDQGTSKALIKKMIEHGYLDTRFVKGKGYLSRCYEQGLKPSAAVQYE